MPILPDLCLFPLTGTGNVPDSDLPTLKAENSDSDSEEDEDDSEEERGGMRKAKKSSSSKKKGADAGGEAMSRRDNVMATLVRVCLCACVFCTYLVCIVHVDVHKYLIASA